MVPSGGALVAHYCGYPLSRYTCRATHVAADFLDFIAFCRCSTGVALHPLKILVSHPPSPCAGRCRTEIWLSEKVSRYTGVSQLQLRVSRYTVQLRAEPIPKNPHGRTKGLLTKYPDLPFLPFLEKKSKENHPKKQGFSLYAEPLKSLGKKGLKKARTFLATKKARESQEGGSKRVILADVPRGCIRMFPGTKNRNKGTCGCSPVPKT